jgi:membrane-associated phospholipid phosphatase
MLKKPLDYHEKARTGAVRGARLFSNIVSPPVMFAVLGLVIAWHELDFWPGLGWAVVYGLLVSLSPILFILYLLRTGRIAELHMSDTRERHLPYLSAVGFAALTLLIIHLADGPELLRCLTLFNLVELTALGLINVFWLISIHATGIMATAVIVGLIFGWGAAWALAPLVILVCWVRLFLKRHTPAQVIAGLALGVASVWAITLIGCF